VNLGAAIDYARQFAYDAPAMHHDYEQTADAFAALLDALAGREDLADE
jgi:hypothetical protein